MKKNSIVFSILFVLVILAPTTLVRAADGPGAVQGLTLTINGSALLAIKNVGSIGLTLTGASQAGAAIKTVIADSTTRLLISSLVTDPVLTSRTITAKVSVVPTGADLVLSVLTPTTDFAGGGATEYGTLGSKTLTTDDQPIITGIKNCWSGTAADCGYVIVYTVNVTNAPSLTALSTQVTYTISEPG